MLAHNDGHFEALVTSPGLQTPYVPLVDVNLNRLPIPFLPDEVVGKEFSLLDKYLCCEYSPKGYLVCTYYDAVQHELLTSATKHTEDLRPGISIPSDLVYNSVVFNPYS